MTVVRIIARSTIVRFTTGLSGNKDHRAVKSTLDSWFQEVRRAEWKNSSDVKASYAHASIVGADRVVFNIKGDAYRLVTAVDYQRGIVFIKWLGSHKDCDATDVRTVQYASKTDQD
jgi:mRNA interferase HigB